MLSITLAVYNEEKNLSKCLESIKDLADEIIIVDGGSNDKTVEIAKKYNSKIFITVNPLIFHINKQKAIDMAKGDWILQLDADEIVSPELKKEITDTISNKSACAVRQLAIGQSVNGFYLPRRNYFLGHWMKKGGLYPDYVIRLFINGKGKFPCKSVHEQIEIDGKIGFLKNDLFHFTNSTVGDYWKNSVIRYSNLTAFEILKNNKKPSLNLGIKYLITDPIKMLFDRMIKHKGIYDGLPGIIFAIGSAIHYPLAYLKYLKLSKQKQLNNF